MNTFGNIFRLTTFGESHGKAIGGIIDGVPSGFSIDIEAIAQSMHHRRPGHSSIVSQRSESDEVKFLSGIFEGKTLGSSIGFIIPNTDVKSDDYANMKDIYRPSHADFTYEAKYGLRDWRGGGRASARETAARVVAGAIASQILSLQRIKIVAFTRAIGNITMPDADFDSVNIYSSAVRCPHAESAKLMEKQIIAAQDNNDSIGGIVECHINGIIPGLGEPIANKFQSMLAAAMMSIPAAKAFEYGMGFDGCRMRGSEVADIFYKSTDGNTHTRTNHSGGIQGGITNGEDIYFRIGFKPTPTLMMEIESIDRDGNHVIIHPTGRHDSCVVPRAVAVVEAMAAMVTLDALMMHRANKL